MHSTTRSVLPSLLLSIVLSLTLSTTPLAKADVITQLRDGTVYQGKTSGTRYLSLLGNTENKLISTSFASLGKCPDEYGLGSPCITFKLADRGQLDDMDHHPGASERQRNFVGSPDLDEDDSHTVTWNMMLERASAQPGFFHLAQVIGDGGPAWTMSIFSREAGDMVAIIDANASGSNDDPNAHFCDSMSLASFMSAPMAISVSLNTAKQSMHWAVTNMRTRKVVMTCHKDGNAGLSKHSSVQGGAYRRVLDGLTRPAVSMIGNFLVTNGHYGRLVNPKGNNDDDSDR